MGTALIEHLPWACALLATLAALELLRRLRLARRRVLALSRDHNRVTLSLDLALSIGRMGSWQFERADSSLFWSDEVFAIHQRDPRRGQPGLEEAIAYYHPDDRLTVADAVQRALDHGEDYDFRARIITDSGEQREVMSRGTCRFDRDGTPIGMLGYIIDITAGSAGQG
ncbi:PAS domain-containing protein [Sphingomonas sp. 35-24ZXX]|uniref:PAS domain-containing protein n=1 Tax=Sphingomonas sp. 35-24ZXX TaxID=1545915 RepID=UPI00053BF2F7|nr:PAS domain-containing protein [Sphingomonas sp. 35-24ZXX]